MSRQNRSIRLKADPLKLAVATKYYHDKNKDLERTAERLMLLVGYMQTLVDAMEDSLDGMNTPFSMKVKNRTARINAAVGDFIKVMEPDIITDARAAYVEFSEILFASLDSFFTDMHREDDIPSVEVRRRAKLRYHDPYKTDVAERTAAFEDGYAKGYIDCVDDIHRQLRSMPDDEHGDAVVHIEEDGKVRIRKVEP